MNSLHQRSYKQSHKCITYAITAIQMLSPEMSGDRFLIVSVSKLVDIRAKDPFTLHTNSISPIPPTSYSYDLYFNAWTDRPSLNYDS